MIARRKMITIATTSEKLKDRSKKLFKLIGAENNSNNDEILLLALESYYKKINNSISK